MEETTNSLRGQITQIADEAGARSVAVAFFDSRHKTEWSYKGDHWFHAASTIKVPVLLGVFGAVEKGRLTEFSRVHVRNRFYSVVDGSPFKLESGRDANSEVHSSIGKTMQVRELARHMIVTSSNLATNLLIDIVGIEEIDHTLKELGLNAGIEFRRGVEDNLAWDKDINNRVTATGLLMALRMIAEERAISEDASRHMLDILHGQEFKRGIPAGLPDDARVAHKTGEISTVAHDAGIVYLPDREPYVVVILTEWEPSKSGRQDAIAKISRAVYEQVTEGDDRSE
ncbi:MAG TPA: serine hydrolase [Longimicrobiales bacterium]|nr:serine hydrolase [Longimicrobiales bacterium]